VASRHPSAALSGYYQPDPALRTIAAMRPSATFNQALELLAK